MCYFPHRNGVYSYNIYSRIQSGNHIAFTTIYVFEHIEASQTKRRDSIYVVIKVWWTLPFWGHQFTNFMVQTWKYSRMNSAVEKIWNQQVIRWQLQKFYMHYYKVSYVFPQIDELLGGQLQSLLCFLKSLRNRWPKTRYYKSLLYFF